MFCTFDFNEKGVAPLFIQKLAIVLGVTPQFDELDAGDILVSDGATNVVFERKIITDFMSSIFDRRIDEQLSTFKETIHYIVYPDSFKSLTQVYKNHTAWSTTVSKINACGHTFSFCFSEASAIAYIKSLSQILLNSSQRLLRPIKPTLRVELSPLVNLILTSVKGVRTTNLDLLKNLSIEKAVALNVSEIQELGGFNKHSPFPQLIYNALH